MTVHCVGALVCIPVPLTIAYLRRVVVETFVQPGLVSPRAGLTHDVPALASGYSPPIRWYSFYLIKQVLAESTISGLKLNSNK